MKPPKGINGECTGQDYYQHHRADCTGKKDSPCMLARSRARHDSERNKERGHNALNAAFKHYMSDKGVIPVTRSKAKELGVEWDWDTFKSQYIATHNLSGSLNRKSSHKQKGKTDSKEPKSLGIFGLPVATPTVFGSRPGPRPERTMVKDPEQRARQREANGWKRINKFQPDQQWEYVAKNRKQLGYDFKGINMVVNATSGKRLTRFEYEQMQVLHAQGIEYYLIGDTWQMHITPESPKRESGWEF